MFTTLLSYLAFLITTFITSLSYPGIFLLMAAESACIPIPSEIIMPFSGFLASLGKFNFLGVVLVGVLGEVFGSSLAWLIGRNGGRKVIERFGKYILISRRDLERSERWFSRYGEPTVFFCRLLPVVRTFISFPAGISQMPYPKFITYTFLGTLIWVSALTYLGFILGENWQLLGEYFHKFDLAILVLIIVGATWYIWRHIKNLKKDGEK